MRAERRVAPDAWRWRPLEAEGGRPLPDAGRASVSPDCPLPTEISFEIPSGLTPDSKKPVSASVATPASTPPSVLAASVMAPPKPPAASGAPSGAPSGAGNRDGEVDEDLHSRQLAVYGRDAMARMGKARVLVVGGGGLAAEVAKNVVLAGVRGVTVLDSALTKRSDLGTHFYLTEADAAASAPRAEAARPRLAELNPAVDVRAEGWTGGPVSAVGDALDALDVEKCATALREQEFNCVCATDLGPATQRAATLAAACRRSNIPLVLARTRGVFGQLFCDFGSEWVVSDVDGERPRSAIVAGVAAPGELGSGVVDPNAAGDVDADGRPLLNLYCVEDERLEVEEGDVVTLSELVGLDGLNGCRATVIAASPRLHALRLAVDVSTISVPDGAEPFSTIAALPPYVKGGLVTQVKQPRTVRHASLEERLVSPGEFLLMDFAKWDRAPQLHLAFRGLDKWETERSGASPKAWCETDAASLVATCEGINRAAAAADAAGHEDASAVETVDQETIGLLAKVAGCRDGLAPMTAMFGGLAGQEVIKACGGKFCPVSQWLYFDACEALPKTRPSAGSADVAPSDSRHDLQTAVFGRAFQAKLAAMRIFVVGAGALGCELLKNLALCGAGCSRDADAPVDADAAMAAQGDREHRWAAGGDAAAGRVTVTDDDQIERSNLSRQFLFRDGDIGHAKSAVAARAARRINPALAACPLEERVSPDTENVFGDAFWSSTDVVLNALDNVKARLYVDQRCVYHGRPLLESGTLGAKCNTQCVLPGLTENYGASRDPPEKEAPMCTVHSFPHTIDHTLVWGRSEFEGMFEAGPRDASRFLADPAAYLQEARASRDVAAKEGLEKCLALLDEGTRPTDYDGCVAWARGVYESHFVRFVKQLTTTFPEDAVTSTGAPFWSPPKRFPRPVEFDPADATTARFIRGCARLKAQVHSLTEPAWAADADEVARRAAAVPVEPWKPAESVKIETDPEAKAPAASARLDDDSVVDSLADRLEAAIPTLSAAGVTSLVHVPFEKDDDTNGHIDVIAGAANLRARAYGITEVEPFQCKLIAGRIVPAVATATAMATGLVCLELYKVADACATVPAAAATGAEHPTHARPVEDYRNTFANLALPLFAMSEPVACARLEHRYDAADPACVEARAEVERLSPALASARCALPATDPATGEAIVGDADGKVALRWTLWDRWVLPGDPTVAAALAWFAARGLEAYSVSCGPALLFNNIFPKHQERLGQRLSELASTVGKLDLAGLGHFDVVVACEDAEGEDVDLPLVSVELDKK